MKSTFLITYQVFDSNEKIIKEGKMRVKNKESELSAKIGLEAFFKKKLPNFKRVYVLKCINENPLNGLGTDEILRRFKDIFGGNFPL